MDTYPTTGDPAADTPDAQHGAPDDRAPSDQGFADGGQPGRPNGFFDGIRRTGLYRADDRWVGGVSAGLADHFGLDPLLVRGLFAASILLGGFGLIAYGVAWALLPEQRDGRIHTEEMVAGRFDVALLGALAAVVVGFGRGDHWFWFWGGPPGWLTGILGVAFLAVIGWQVVVAVNNRSAANAHAAAQARTGRPPYPADSTAPAAAASAPAVTGTPPAPYGSPYTSRSKHHGRAPHATRPSDPCPAPSDAPPYSWQPRPAKPARTGPGAHLVGEVVALSLITTALLLLADWSGDFNGPVALTALAVTTILAGLGIIAAGLRGRTSGALGAIGILAILFALPAGAGHGPGWLWKDGFPDHVTAASVDAGSRADARRGYELGFGDATVDLTQVPMTSTTLEVPISLGAGVLTIVVPDDAAVAADVQVGAGSVTWDVDGEHEQADGVGNARTFTDRQSDDRDPQLLLHVDVGAGDVIIRDEER